MALENFFDWLESWPVSAGIRETSWMFPAFESVHVIAITLVVGTVMVVDLRVLGFASRKLKVSELTGSVLPWTWLAFVVAAISGSFLFAAKAQAYFDNFHFRAKMILMALAFVNMLAFHYGPFRSVSSWDSGNQAPSAARLSCGLSLAFWIVILTMGRWIGYSIEG